MRGVKPYRWKPCKGGALPTELIAPPAEMRRYRRNLLRVNGLANGTERQREASGGIKSPGLFPNSVPALFRFLLKEGGVLVA